MSNNYWFQYDKSTGVIYSYQQSAAPASSSTVGVLGPYPVETATPDIVMAYTFTRRFLAQGSPVALVEQPYFTLSSTTNGNTVTVTATLQNPPATPPTSATFTVNGQTFTEAITNSVATLTIDLHPSIAGYLVNAAVSATGCVSETSNIGGTATSPVSLQAVTPSSGNPIVGPSGAAAVPFLQNYYALNGTTVQAILTNTMTAISLLYDALFNVIVPAVNPTLTADQQNALNTLKADVLGSLPTTLANGYPSGGTEQMQFGAFVQHFQTASTAVTAFMDALATFNL